MLEDVQYNSTFYKAVYRIEEVMRRWGGAMGVCTDKDMAIDMLQDHLRIYL